MVSGASWGMEHPTTKMSDGEFGIVRHGIEIEDRALVRLHFDVSCRYFRSVVSSPSSARARVVSASGGILGVIGFENSIV